MIPLQRIGKNLGSNAKDSEIVVTKDLDQLSGRRDSQLGRHIQLMNK